MGSWEKDKTVEKNWEKKIIMKEKLRSGTKKGRMRIIAKKKQEVVPKMKK